MADSSISINTPIIFADGREVYDQLAKTYIKHSHGLFILAPSGSGKTYFIDHQPPGKRHWIDGDLLWSVTNADPTNSSWVNDSLTVQTINIRSDIITTQAKQLGFWIMGASNQFLKPDAIVLPPLETHINYITNREKDNYNGGAKAKDLEKVKSHRKWIEHWVAEGVPCYDSITLATESLANY